MKPILRPASLQDAQAIADAEIEIAETPGLFCSQPSEINVQNVIKTITELKAKKGFYLVAELDDKIVGHAFVEPLHLKSICHVGQIMIGVHKGWQEKGIGTVLMEEIIKRAKDSQEREPYEMLQPEDIASAILFAFQQSQNVCIREIVICPTRQVI